MLPLSNVQYNLINKYHSHKELRENGIFLDDIKLRKYNKDFWKNMLYSGLEHLTDLSLWDRKTLITNRINKSIVKNYRKAINFGMSEEDWDIITNGDPFYRHINYTSRTLSEVLTAVMQNHGYMDGYKIMTTNNETETTCYHIRSIDEWFDRKHESMKKEDFISTSLIRGEIDNHSIDLSTEEGRNELKEWHKKMEEIILNYDYQGTYNYATGRSVYLNYQFDRDLTYNEAEFLTKYIRFRFYQTTGLTMDENLQIVSSQYIPMTMYCSTYIDKVVTPISWTDYKIDTTRFIDEANNYINDYSDEFYDFIHEPERIKKCNNDFSSNYEKMIKHHFDSDNAGLSSLAEKNIDLIRIYFGINKKRSKMTYGQAFRYILQELGPELHTLMNRSQYKFQRSCFKDDRHPSMHLNLLYNKIADKNIDYIYHYNDLPSGNVIDITMWLCFAKEGVSEEEAKKQAVELLAEVLNVEIVESVQFSSNINKRDQTQIINRLMGSIKRLYARNHAVKANSCKELKAIEIVNDIIIKQSYEKLSKNITQVMLTCPYIKKTASEVYGVDISTVTISRIINLLVTLKIIRRLTNKDDINSLNLKKKLNVKHNIPNIFILYDFEERVIVNGIEYSREKYTRNIIKKFFKEEQVKKFYKWTAEDFAKFTMSLPKNEKTYKANKQAFVNFYDSLLNFDEGLNDKILTNNYREYFLNLGYRLKYPNIDKEKMQELLIDNKNRYFYYDELPLDNYSQVIDYLYCG